MSKQLLRIDASARHAGSVTRELGDELESRWLEANPAGEVNRRDLSQPLPLLDEDWVDANLTDPAERSAQQRETLALSDALIDELRAADALLVTVPLYNFGIPAALKAWLDLVCRARETFAYTEEGPRGLLGDRPVYLVMATGGVPIGSAADFASGYLRQVFAFIGLEDIHLVAAEQVNIDAERALTAARKALKQLPFAKPADAAA